MQQQTKKLLWNIVIVKPQMILCDAQDSPDITFKEIIIQHKQI
jgi:hypothetical protein